MISGARVLVEPKSRKRRYNSLKQTQSRRRLNLNRIGPLCIAQAVIFGYRIYRRTGYIWPSVNRKFRHLNITMQYALIPDKSRQTS